MTEAEEQALRAQLKTVTAERNRYHAELTDLRLQTIEADLKATNKRIDDHEDRLREQETIGTRFNTVYALFGANVLVALLLKFAVP